MHDQLGSTIIFASAALICLYYAVRCLMGKQTVRADQPLTDRSRMPRVAHHATPMEIPEGAEWTPTETPADAEWRRRLARWTAEDAS